MAKNKNDKVVEVKLDNGETIKVIVKRPSNRINANAQRVAAKVWTDCVRDGIMTKKELEKFMEESGVWTKGKMKSQDQIVTDIQSLERRLYLGKKGSKMKVSAAKDIALEMRQKRQDLRDLIGERIELETNSAESLSDNAKFDFLVANCTFKENGEDVYYTSVEDYESLSEDPVAFQAASALAEMIYAVDKDFEAKLPENRFLKRANLVNEDLSLVDKKGQRVDVEGRHINDIGHYLDDEGGRVDADGHPLDKDGNYIPQMTYTADNGRAIKFEEDEEEKPAEAEKPAEEEASEAEEPAEEESSEAEEPDVTEESTEGETES
jgi:hypothetical protein